ncbi:MAG TPA: hypothetical protein VG826_29615 [Pirellulales bacterium]|nr:hypothetical protein [Pirellulales bacterium]
MKIEFDNESLKPIIEQAVSTAVAALASTLPNDGRLAYHEHEAAAMLGLTRQQLGSERRLGRIKASVGPRGRMLYSRQNLLDYLSSRQWAKDQ